ncbi:MAG: serine hydrolase [Gemmatimonadetes bacterium]|nr:serine hydrolase [Gemmatimonadota bacterium]
MNRRYLAALVLLVASATTAFAQSAAYSPGKDWAHRSPAQVGLEAAWVDSAMAHAKANETNAPRDQLVAHDQSGFGREPLPTPICPMKERGDMTGIVVRHGYIVAEWGEPDRVDMTHSVTKSFLSTVVGLAFERGLIKSLDDHVKDYVRTSEWDTPHNALITWDHMLRQTSDWEGTMWSKPDWADRPPSGTPIEEYKKRVHNEPGTTYKYNDVRVNALSWAALQVWRKPLPEVLKDLVMDPIGASNTWHWYGYDSSWVELDGKRVQSVSGGGHWGGGMFISARDQARFGLLTLNKGKWNGKQILPESWITRARTPTGPQPTYGFMNYFLNTANADGRRPWPDATPETFCHIGNGTNAVCEVPEYDMVVVMRWINGNSGVNGVIKRLIAAAGGTPKTS